MGQLAAAISPYMSSLQPYITPWYEWHKKGRPHHRGENFPYSFQTVVWALFYVRLDLTNETDEQNKANGFNCQTTLIFVFMINISYNVKGKKLIKMFNKWI